ncbi:MAG: hypothetical protein ACYC3X_18150 [Pirellulaceae bacterium]
MKRILLALVAMILVASPLCVDVSTAADGVNINGKLNLDAMHVMLTKGLKATREDEKLYIDYVMILVAEKVLPVSLVYASFDYSRKRRPDYPFPYFEQSLRTLAKRKNIDVAFAPSVVKMKELKVQLANH